MMRRHFATFRAMWRSAAAIHRLIQRERRNMGVQHHLSKMAAGASTCSLLCGLVLFAVLTDGLLTPGLAAADPTPLWSDPITTSAWSAYGAGGREVMYVNALQMGTLDTERVIGPDGAVEYQAETGNTTIAPPALAADGSGYVLRGGDVAGVIDAIDTAGRVRWSYTVPAQDTVRALLAGSDGAAYVVVSNAIDDEVLRLSAVDGSVTFDTPLPDGNYSDGFLFAEPSGVAAITGTHVLFLSQQGQITADVAAIPSGSATWFTSNTAGDVFVGTASAGGGQVNTAGGITVSKVDPTGQLDWTTQTPANNGGGQSTGLAALPDGGVAYEVAGQSIGVLNTDGTIRWSTEDPHGYGPMLTDSADHVDFEKESGYQNCSDGLSNCFGFGVDQLEASNGQVQRSLSLVYTNNDPSQFFFCEGFSLGSGLFYVVDRLSPGDGETCNNGLTQLQLQAFALPGTTGPYPSPPVTTIPPTTETTGGGGGTGLGAPGGGGSQSGGNVTHNLPIVLIPGINSETEETGPKTKPSCPSKEPFEAMCLALRKAGYPVYVVGSSVGPSKATLDSIGDIDANAYELTRFLKGTVKQPALIVAHSLGGLIARVAISRDEAPAAGLFTIGTPYDGSYVADVGSKLNGINCILLLSSATPSCAIIQLALRTWLHIGSVAVSELTKEKRTQENKGLPPLPLPLWTMAGTGIHIPSGVTGLLASTALGYYFPNDILVGVSSAWGVGANPEPICKGEFTDIEIGCSHRLSTNAFHFDSLFRIPLPLPGPAETSDPAIISEVLAVARNLSRRVSATATAAAAHPRTASAPAVATVASAAGNNRRLHTVHKKPHVKPSVTAIALTAINGGMVNTPQMVPISAQGFVVADHSFSVSCNGESWEAEGIAPGVWAMFGGTVRCATVAQLPAGSGYLSAAPAPRASIHVTVTTRGLSTIVRVSGPELSATLSRPGKHTIPLRRVHGHWQVVVRRAHGVSVTITVVRGHEIFSGTFSFL